MEAASCSLSSRLSIEQNISVLPRAFKSCREDSASNPSTARADTTRHIGGDGAATGQGPPAMFILKHARVRHSFTVCGEPPARGALCRLCGTCSQGRANPRILSPCVPGTPLRLCADFRARHASRMSSAPTWPTCFLHSRTKHAEYTGDDISFDHLFLSKSVSM